ncbi:host attachment protein [Legionella qingyii]|uniref:Host attachment protein n=1 Tax=Legionella qingyii TaxID=2184757 RepID=A0A317TZ51_9GAMM|nr:host attachment protein [Legionella qingyii]PWY54358.1 host attachment protein [Legionella qingyii]RUR24099.1 host attachment protein [Legionella qingyii]RUR24300.1 host attachment protein [Legionella qingyii]
MSSNQHATWVLILNSNECRIYELSTKPYQLALLKEILHPESKLRDIELTSDKPGRYKTDNPAHGTFAQPSDPKEIQIDDFSRQVAKELNNDRNIEAYKNLIVVAPPHMNGLLFQHLNKHVKELVTHNIKNDILNLTEPELAEFLHQHILR